MLKKTLILFTSIIFVTISFITPVFAKTFSDVDENTDYYEAIQWMGNEGVVEGYEDGTFGPDTCVNRVEFLKMLYETLGIDENRYYGELFPDTIEGEWYENYILAARTKETVEGYEDGYFRPANCVNRVEAIKMAVLEFNNGEVPKFNSTYNDNYTDIEKGEWYFGSFDYTFSINLVGLEHISEGSFNPGGDMNRKEVVELLYRMKAIKDKDLTVFEVGAVPISAGYVPGEFIDITVDELGISFSYPEEWGELEIANNECNFSYVKVKDGDDSYSLITILKPICGDRGGDWPDTFGNIENIEPEEYCTEFSDNPEDCELFATNNDHPGMKLSSYITNMYVYYKMIPKFKDYIYVFDHPWEWNYMVAVSDYNLLNNNFDPYFEEQLKAIAKSLSFTEQPEYMKGEELIEMTSLTIELPNETYDYYKLQAEGTIDASCEAKASFEFDQTENTFNITYNKRRISEECLNDTQEIPLNFDLGYFAELELGKYTVEINGMVFDSFQVE